MKKATMPEPAAYLYVNGEHRGVSLDLRGDMDLSEGTDRQALVTVEQAEAYAQARVREAAEPYAPVDGKYGPAVQQAWHAGWDAAQEVDDGVWEALAATSPVYLDAAMRYRKLRME